MEFEYGFFSWLACDDQESIANAYTSKSKPVYLLRPDGSEPIYEPAYEGYGVFGGVNALIQLAKDNSHLYEGEDLDEEVLFHLGVELLVGERKHEVKYPLKFSFDPKCKYEDHPASLDCPHQGYFYN